MPNPPAEILTSFQKELLKLFHRTVIGEKFFLTGGTALAACYLHHRLSEDLDFFTEEPGAVAQVLPILDRFPKTQISATKVTRQFGSFIEAFITSPAGETVKIDFAQDTAFRLRPTESSPWDMRVDNSLDIACNKLSALFDRADAKDFVDIYFIVQRLTPFDELLTQAGKKHIGMDP